MDMYLFIILLSLKLSPTICESNCENFESCSACIQSFDKCVWCPAESHVGTRCQSQDYHIKNKNWCKSNINIPETEIETKENFDWTSGKNGGKTIQIRPQRVVIKMASVGIPMNVTMKYKPAKDEPLDVYYLMDNTLDIQEYKITLGNQAALIFQELKSYTNNVRLGIGSFVDKPAIPFANPDTQYAYCFKNDLPLTNDTELFKKTLDSMETGSNADRPEAVFDGLIQSMLCNKDIDWRKDGRRFIIVVTNAFYHSAGDGPFVGALKRHDMKCHINGSMDTILDYPSISQINKVAREGGYTIIFAVDSHVRESYNNVAEGIVGAKCVSLTDSNIAKIIKQQYIKVIKKIHVTNNASSHIQVNVEKVCQNCIALHYQPLELLVTIKVMSCPDPPRSSEIVKMSPTSLNEGLLIEIQFNCQCECEKNVVYNSSKCNHLGDYQCGKCKCNSNRYGEFCSCEGNTMNSKDDSNKCKKNHNDTLECSGHGDCRCGKCEPCHVGFSGQFCQYDDNACTRRNGKQCSGHGKCTLGSCQCDSKWVSLPGTDDCGCSIDQTPCIAPYSDKVCSGNGKCQCGHCICNTIENSNDTCKARFCDKCHTVLRCMELEDFAYCRFLKKTTCEDEYKQKGTVVLFANREDLNSARNTEWYKANSCRVTKGDSIFIFKYYYSTDESDSQSESDQSTLVLVIQNELDELPPANIWVPIGSSIGGILLVGLVSLLLWKVLTDFYDAREYNQFLEKARAAGFDVTENPHYEPPVQTYCNPTYDS